MGRKNRKPVLVDLAQVQSEIMALPIGEGSWAREVIKPHSEYTRKAINAGVFERFPKQKTHVDVRVTNGLLRRAIKAYARYIRSGGIDEAFTSQTDFVRWTVENGLISV